MLGGILRVIAQEHSPAVLASSLSAEDMVLTHAIASARLPIGVFVLDTGRLNAETLSLVGEIERIYGLKVDVYRPVAKDVAHYVGVHGRDAFYGSVELRKRCCEIRKVEPLVRALEPYDAWASGIRRDQSPSRVDTQKVEWSERYGVWKLHPLADWDEKRVWAYIHVNEIPFNPLHETGYRSIGCIPCTRPTTPDEEERAGRWAGSDKLECGIHAPTERNA
jgi:phosphoadenosine phosphosulfate reductase